jgi:uncharacterized protein YggE
MKKMFMIAGSLFLFGTISFAQEGGNEIYGNNGSAQRRQVLTNTGSLQSNRPTGYSVEASVLLNLKPDAFVAVFGVQNDALSSTESNVRVDAKVSSFERSLGSLGVPQSDIFVDFITQNRVYDFAMQGNQAVEKSSGFETKKTIAVRYKSRDMLEKIIAAAASSEIFDLIKVDYIVSDFDAVQKRLFDEGVEVIKAKEAKYIKAFGTRLEPVGLANEKYNAFYPGERYQRYQAYETGNAYATGGSVLQRKSFTFYYQPLSGNDFDRMINPIGVEPLVQFTLYLRMDYDVAKKKTDG